LKSAVVTAIAGLERLIYPLNSLGLTGVGVGLAKKEVRM
jgi:hypothetical protein